MNLSRITENYWSIRGQFLHIYVNEYPFAEPFQIISWLVFFYRITNADTQGIGIVNPDEQVKAAKPDELVLMNWYS